MSKIIWLTQGQFTLVDDDDYEWLNQWKWQSVKDNRVFYAVKNFTYQKGKRRLIKMHRLILGITDSSIKVDHQDRNGLNNLRTNLRVVTDSQNMSNRASAKNSTSKYLGVCWDKFMNRWRAVIQKDRKNKKLGSFSNEIDAALAYNKAAIELHGEFANLNKI